jgi:hypothetical protein
MKVSNFHSSRVLLAGFCLAGVIQVSTQGQNSQGAPAATSADPATSAQDAQAQLLTQAAPDFILYGSFFQHVADMDKIAAKRESEGKNEAGFREHDWRAAGLTEEEGASMKEIALDCIQRLQEQRDQMRAQYAAQAIDPSDDRATRGTANAIIRPSETRRQIVEDHIAQLKQTLTDESYAKLDGYVRTLLGWKSVNAPLQAPSHKFDPLVPDAPVNPNVPVKTEDPSTTDKDGGKN